MQPNFTNLRYGNVIKLKIMRKTLNVIEDFAYLTPGDVFVLSDDGKEYVAEENYVTDEGDENNSFKSSFSSKFAISPSYARELIKHGILEDPYDVKTDDGTFVNVFDEIDTLIDQYETDLQKLPKEMEDQPECLKVEKTTVLTNLVNVLKHLKSLKK